MNIDVKNALDDEEKEVTMIELLITLAILTIPFYIYKNLMEIQ